VFSGIIKVLQMGIALVSCPACQDADDDDSVSGPTVKSKSVIHPSIHPTTTVRRVFLCNVTKKSDCPTAAQCSHPSVPDY
jgi:hypothetical protein